MADTAAPMPRSATADVRRARELAGRSLVSLLRVLGDALALTVATRATGVPSTLVPALVVLGTIAARPAALQRQRLDLRPSDVLAGLVSRLAPVGLGIAVLAPVDQRLPVVLATGAALVLVPAGRAAHRWGTHAVRRRGLGLEPTLVVGCGPVGQAIARVLARRPEFGLDPVGFVDTDGCEGLDGPLLGRPEDLPRLLVAQGARRVVVAWGGEREHELVPSLRAAARAVDDLRLHAVPRFFELGTTVQSNADDIWGFPLVPVRRPGLSPLARRAKRGADLVGATVLLVLLALPMALIALLVRRSGPGSVLFRQDRVGLDGSTFELLKFRTMRPVPETAASWAEDATRVTRVGAVLRPTHLDELPQLFNVLRGDMSLVGPRPERPEYAAVFATEHRGYDHRHRVPAGLTGWAQVNGLWGNTSIADRARFDNRYIEDWSPWRELAILLRTVPTLLGGRVADDGAGVVELAADPTVDHVVHVLETTDPTVESVVAEIARAQARGGKRVHVVGPTAPHLARRLALSGVEHVDAGSATTGLPGLDGVLDRLGPGLVHLHGIGAAHAGRVATRGRRPTVVQMHGRPDADRPVDGAASAELETLLGRWGHAVVCATARERHDAEALGAASPVHVVPRPIDIAPVDGPATASPADARRGLGLGEAPTLLLVVDGADDVTVELRPLVEVLRDAVADVQVVVTGTRVGDLPAGARVVAPGHVDAWMAAADVVAVVGPGGDLPDVALRAMAAGRSLVLTEAHADRPDVEAGGAVVVDAGDPDQLASAVARRLHDRGLAAAEGAALRVHVDARHGADHVVSLLDDVYATALERWGGVPA